MKEESRQSYKILIILANSSRITVLLLVPRRTLSMRRVSRKKYINRLFVTIFYCNCVSIIEKKKENCEKRKVEHLQVFIFIRKSVKKKKCDSKDCVYEAIENEDIYIESVRYNDFTIIILLLMFSPL